MKKIRLRRGYYCKSQLLDVIQTSFTLILIFKATAQYDTFRGDAEHSSEIKVIEENVKILMISLPEQNAS